MKKKVWCASLSLPWPWRTRCRTSPHWRWCRQDLPWDLPCIHTLNAATQMWRIIRLFQLLIILMNWSAKFTKVIWTLDAVVSLPQNFVSMFTLEVLFVPPVRLLPMKRLPKLFLVAVFNVSLDPQNPCCELTRSRLMDKHSRNYEMSQWLRIVLSKPVWKALYIVVASSWCGSTRGSWRCRAALSCVPRISG